MTGSNAAVAVTGVCGCGCLQFLAVLRDLYDWLYDYKLVRLRDTYDWFTTKYNSG